MAPTPPRGPRDDIEGIPRGLSSKRSRNKRARRRSRSPVFEGYRKSSASRYDLEREVRERRNSLIDQREREASEYQRGKSGFRNAFYSTIRDSNGDLGSGSIATTPTRETQGPAASNSQTIAIGMQFMSGEDQLEEASFLRVRRDDHLEITSIVSGDRYSCRNLRTKDTGLVRSRLLESSHQLNNRSKDLGSYQEHNSDVLAQNLMTTTTATPKPPTSSIAGQTMVVSQDQEANDSGIAIHLRRGDRINILKHVSGVMYYGKNLESGETGQVNMSFLKAQTNPQSPTAEPSKTATMASKHTGLSRLALTNGTIVKALNDQLGNAPYLEVQKNDDLEIVAFQPIADVYVCRSIRTNEMAQVRRALLEILPEPTRQTEILKVKTQVAQEQPVAAEAKEPTAMDTTPSEALPQEVNTRAVDSAPAPEPQNSRVDPKSSESSSQPGNPDTVATLIEAMMKIFDQSTSLAAHRLERRLANKRAIHSKEEYLKTKSHHEKFPAIKETAAWSYTSADRELRRIDEKLKVEEAQLNTVTKDLAEKIIPAILASRTTATPPYLDPAIKLRQDTFEESLQGFNATLKGFQKLVEKQQKLIDEQRETIESQTTRITNLEANDKSIDIDIVKKDFLRVQSDVAATSKHIPALETDLEKLRTTCAPFQTKIASFANTTDDLGRRVAKIEEENSKQCESLTSTNNNLQQVIKKVDNTRAVLIDLDKRAIMHLTNDDMQSIREIQGSKDRITALETKANAASSVAATSVAQATQATQARLDKFDSRVKIVEGKVSASAAPNPDYGQAISRLQETLASNSSTLTGVQVKIANPVTPSANYEPAIAELQSAVTQLQRNGNANATTLESIKVSHSETQAKFKEAEDKIEAGNNTVVNLASRVDNIYTNDVANAMLDQAYPYICQRVPELKDVPALKKDLGATRQTQFQLTGRVNILEGQSAGFAQQSINRNETEQALQAAVRDLEGRINTLECAQSAVSESRRGPTTLQTEVDRVSTEFVKIKTQLKTEVDILRTEMEALQEDAHDFQNQAARVGSLEESANDENLMKEVQDSVEALRSEVSELTSQVKPLKSDGTQARNDIDQIRKDVSTFCDKHSTLQDRVSTLETEGDKISKQANDDGETLMFLQRWKNKEGLSKNEFESYKAEAGKEHEDVTNLVKDEVASVANDLEKLEQTQAAETSEMLARMSGMETIIKTLDNRLCHQTKSLTKVNDEVTKLAGRAGKLENTTPVLNMYTKLNDNVTDLTGRVDKLEQPVPKPSVAPSVSGSIMSIKGAATNSQTNSPIDRQPNPLWQTITPIPPSRAPANSLSNGHPKENSNSNPNRELFPKEKRTHPVDEAKTNGSAKRRQISKPSGRLREEPQYPYQPAPPKVPRSRGPPGPADSEEEQLAAPAKAASRSTRSSASKVSTDAPRPSTGKQIPHTPTPEAPLPPNLKAEAQPLDADRFVVINPTKKGEVIVLDDDSD